VNRSALSKLDMAKELSGLRRGGILLFSFRIFFVALHSELSEFERDFKYVRYFSELCFRRIFFKEFASLL